VAPKLVRAKMTIFRLQLPRIIVNNNPALGPDGIGVEEVSARYSSWENLRRLSHWGYGVKLFLQEFSANVNYFD